MLYSCHTLSVLTESCKNLNSILSSESFNCYHPNNLFILFSSIRCWVEQQQSLPHPDSSRWILRDFEFSPSRHSLWRHVWAHCQPIHCGSIIAETLLEIRTLPELLAIQPELGNLISRCLLASTLSLNVPEEVMTRPYSFKAVPGGCHHQDTFRHDVITVITSWA